VLVTSEGEAVQVSQAQSLISGTESPVVWTLETTFTEGQSILNLSVALYYCEATNESVCLIEDVVFNVPVVVEASTQTREIALERVVVLPEAYR